MSPDTEREYKAWIEEAEARLAARVRWSFKEFPYPTVVEGAWEYRHVEKLKRIRERELVERQSERVRVAGR